MTQCCDGQGSADCSIHQKHEDSEDATAIDHTFNYLGVVVAATTKSTAPEIFPQDTIELHSVETNGQGEVLLVNTREAAENQENKTCPACAEEVKSAAVICRHCGHDFRASLVGRERHVNGLAVGALTAGVVGLLIPPLGAVVALVLGIAALRQIRHADGLQQGRGLAISGIILSGLLFVLTAYLVSTGFFGLFGDNGDTGGTESARTLTGSQQLVDPSEPRQYRKRPTARRDL